LEQLAERMGAEDPYLGGIMKKVEVIAQRTEQEMIIACPDEGICLNEELVAIKKELLEFAEEDIRKIERSVNDFRGLAQMISRENRVLEENIEVTEETLAPGLTGTLAALPGT